MRACVFLGVEQTRLEACRRGDAPFWGGRIVATCWGGDREPRRGVRDGGRRRNPRFTNTRFDGALPRSPTHLLLRRRREAAHAKGA